MDRVDLVRLDLPRGPCVWIESAPVLAGEPSSGDLVFDRDADDAFVAVHLGIPDPEAQAVAAAGDLALLIRSPADVVPTSVSTACADP